MTQFLRLWHKQRQLFALLGLFFMWSFTNNTYQKADKASITLEVTDLRSSMGKVLVSVFNQSNGFPSKPEKAYKTFEQKVQNQKAIVIQINDLPFGDYAIAILHDEDNNGKMNTNFLGIPKEGYGTSNDIKNTFSAPTYEQARFTLNTPQKKLKIKMIY